MGKFVMIVSMPVGKLVWSNVDMIWVMSSGNRVSHSDVAMRDSWMGHLSRSWVKSRCWSDVCASGFASTHAYVRMWWHVLRRASRPVALHPYNSV